MHSDKLDLPKELEIWNEMTAMERWEIMQKVGHHKSDKKYFKACITYIRNNLSEFAAP